MHKKNTIFLFCCLFIVFSVNIALAQPANDNCGNAIEIAIPENGYSLGTFQSLATDLADATVQSGETFAPAIFVAAKIRNRYGTNSLYLLQEK